MMLNKSKVFLGTFFTISVLSILQLFIGNNYSFYFHTDNLDSFMDLFNSLIIPPGNYPPFAQLLYTIVSKLVPDFIDTSLALRQQAFALKGSVPGAFILLLHVLCFMLPLFILSFNLINGSSQKKNIYSLFICFSGVVLFSLERGNIIIYAFLFTLFFLALYKSDIKWQRILGYLFLALAANIKFYPAIFGLLLIIRKDWKGCIFSSISFFIVYVISFYILKIITVQTDSITLTSSVSIVTSWASNTTVKASGQNCSIKNFFMIINGFIYKLSHHKIPLITSKLFFTILQVSVLILGIFTFIFSNHLWKKISCLTLLCIYIPSVSYQYSMLFLLLPLIYFINDESNTKFDLLCALMFAIMVSLLIIPFEINPSGARYPLTAAFLLQQCTMGLFTVILFYSKYY